eukprot:CAMPEP_0204874824 /NCGR_PEP_ID=MMETSP1348-20121228/44215_1 /ASSEMBLY_ACC=CAM_ASM_000700 /TAXON_ID=215587 /ORGANISM="Aplanochytrium stocchinoi, Strain GSBS06" /LENGTH=96 /DNA_ID=CAMNT_0052030891 /DNA_START=1 /DNA_END=291 /DNA_ORIENTATION=-
MEFPECPVEPTTCPKLNVAPQGSTDEKSELEQWTPILSIIGVAAAVAALITIFSPKMVGQKSRSQFSTDYRVSDELQLETRGVNPMYNNQVAKETL